MSRTELLVHMLNTLARW